MQIVNFCCLYLAFVEFACMNDFQAAAQKCRDNCCSPLNNGAGKKNKKMFG